MSKKRTDSTPPEPAKRDRRITVELEDDLYDALNDYRRRQTVPPGVSDVVRSALKAFFRDTKPSAETAEDAFVIRIADALTRKLRLVAAGLGMKAEDYVNSKVEKGIDVDWLVVLEEMGLGKK